MTWTIKDQVSACVGGYQISNVFRMLSDMRQQLHSLLVEST